MIVQNFALKYPDLVNKMVLINTNYGTPDESGPIAYRNMRLDNLKAKQEDPEKAFWKSMLGTLRMKKRRMSIRK